MENNMMNMVRIEDDNTRDAVWKETMLTKMRELARLCDAPVIVIVFTPERGIAYSTQTPDSYPDPVLPMMLPPPAQEVVDLDQADDEFLAMESYMMRKIAKLERALEREEVLNREALARYLLTRTKYEGVDNVLSQLNREQLLTLEWFTRRHKEKFMKSLLLKKKRAHDSSSSNHNSDDGPPMEEPADADDGKPDEISIGDGQKVGV